MFINDGHIALNTTMEVAGPTAEVRVERASRRWRARPAA